MSLEWEKISMQKSDEEKRVSGLLFGIQMNFKVSQLGLLIYFIHLLDPYLTFITL